MKQYRIGDFAKYLGVTPDLLKHYEDMGIIQSRRSESGYRYYPFHTVLFLIESIRLRNYGLTLREIRDILTYKLDNEHMQELLDQKMEVIRQERMLDDALEKDYEDFKEWREPLLQRESDWEIRRSRTMYFLPHTDRYDFLKDPRIYEILSSWMSCIPLVKSAMKTGPDGKVVWGFLADEHIMQRMDLPLNDVVETIPPQRIFYYKFHSELPPTDSEYAGNPDHPAFSVLRALGLACAGSYYRATLLPGNWEKNLNYQYGYYAIPLKERETGRTGLGR